MSIQSGLGEVNAWCTAVHEPLPTATSSSSPVGLNSGASTTHTNDQADSSINPTRRPISRRVAPSRARASDALPAAKNTQSPGAAPTASTRPARSASDRFLATGPPSSPSSPTVTYARPFAPRCLAHSCHASKVRRGCEPPPGMTTAPT